jgi:hypothetical protein
MTERLLDLTTDEGAATIGDIVTTLLSCAPGGAQLPSWPPDVFAIVGTLLQKSGAYTYAVSCWPPKAFGTPGDWEQKLEMIGEEWRANCKSGCALPSEICTWWQTLIQHVALPISEICNQPELCEALLQLCAASDLASEGVGLQNGAMDPFELEAISLLTREGKQGSTLCRTIHPSKARVLPKLHTPQSGMTIRSLTHHLALCPTGEATPVWNTLPSSTNYQSLNLLLVPWPEVVTPAQFQTAKPAQGALLNMPEDFRFFKFDQRPAPEDYCERLIRILDSASQIVGRIDGIVFPEMSLTCIQYEAIKKAVLKREIFLICGIGERASLSTPGKNYVTIDVPVSSSHSFHFEQAKHHRWRLDKSQIVQYGLGSNLDPQQFWWEYIPVGNRSLTFVAMTPWLTLCALICEDLARLDPVSELVRAVGPNLVIALLMDGPQLPSRWPARYATVLADDPGSSVLTFTSLGMCELSRPPYLQDRSRVIALWKDARSGRPVEVALPNNADAVVLSISLENACEWTADGRNDHWATGYPVLSGVHPVVKPG